MFSTILIYLYIFAFLRKKAVSSNDRSTSPHHYGATPLMVLYPLIYTVCTAPLAAGRIYALAGHDVSLGYFCAAGTMIACNGWLDVILYASTRADIVFSELPPGDDTGLETFAFMGKGHRLGTTTTIVATGSSSRNHSVSRAASRSASRTAPRGASRLGKISGRGSNNGESAENLYGLGEIAIKNKVTVSVDAQEHNRVRHDRISMDESANRSRTFDERSHKSRGSRSSRSGKSFDDTEIP
jgi:hypothetical protein